MRILAVLGTRPEAIKLAPVIDELRRHGLTVIVCASGQHGALADRALADAGIEADVRFEPLSVSELEAMTEALAARVGRALSDTRPDWVIVQGDTTTAFAGALAASAVGIPVAHVEAGLRTGDLMAPFPEEGHRRAISTIADLHFAPTVGAACNLMNDGVSAESIVVTGNTAVDAMIRVCRRLDSDPAFAAAAAAEIAAVPRDRRIILLTGHRRENHGAALANVAAAMIGAAQRNDVAVVYVAHPNPGLLDFQAVLADAEAVHALPPLSHAACVMLMRRAFAIVTDSGGIQEEAPSLGIPLLVTRRLTERPEAVDEGAALVVGTDVHPIRQALDRLLDEPDHHREMSKIRHPFGDGRAAVRIVEHLVAAQPARLAEKVDARCAI